MVVFKYLKRNITLILITIVSAFLNFYRLGCSGFCNWYYAACVKSMLVNWHNFLFASFDPAGFQTIDKPPLGFWLQVFSSAIFGFQPWSVLLPQALAGVISVLLLYHLVQRAFGRPAGLIAALVLAITPIFVATARNNTIDVTLVMVLLLAAWSLLIAIEKNSIGYLCASAILVGLGFNIKMSQALLVMPAFYSVYFLTSKNKFGKKILQLAVSGILMAVVSFSWIAAVTFTPQNNRPYIGSTRNNSVVDLVLTHNGRDRIVKKAQPVLQNLPPPTTSGDDSTTVSAQMNATKQGASATPVNYPPPPGKRGQIEWLYPLVFTGTAILLINLAGKKQWKGKKAQSVILWSAWFVPMLLFFTLTKGTFHTYYYVMLAPAAAALVGAGIVELYNAYRQENGLCFLLPAGLAANGLYEYLMLNGYPELRQKLLPSYIICVLSALILGVGLLLKKAQSKKAVMGILTIGIVSLLVSVAAWTVTPLRYGDAERPFAGPDLKEPRNSKHTYPFGISMEYLENYLTEQNGNEKYYLAVQSIDAASRIILDTGMPVIAIGGYTGTDNNFHLEQIKQLIANGELSFFLVDIREREGAPEEQAEVIRWLQKNGIEIEPIKWYHPVSRINEQKSNPAQSQNTEEKSGENVLKLYQMPLSSLP